MNSRLRTSLGHHVDSVIGRRCLGKPFLDPWIIEMIGWLYGGVVAILHFNDFKVKQSQLLDWQNVPDG